MYGVHAVFLNTASTLARVHDNVITSVQLTPIGTARTHAGNAKHVFDNTFSGINGVGYEVCRACECSMSLVEEEYATEHYDCVRRNLSAYDAKAGQCYLMGGSGTNAGLLSSTSTMSTGSCLGGAPCLPNPMRWMREPCVGR